MIYRYNELVLQLKAWTCEYPMLHVDSIGVTADGRDIPRLILGDVYAPHAILLVAGLHAREYLNTAVLMQMISFYLQNWDNDEFCIGGGKLLNMCCLHIVPMLNPDGVTISQDGVDGIQSTTLREQIQQMDGADDYSYWASNGRGVNLNRNFPYKWSKTCDKPASTLYAGDAPASEVETQSLIKVADEREFDAAVMYHSVGNVIFWDLGQTGELREKTECIAKLGQEVTGYSLGEQSVPRGLEYNYLSLEKKIPTILIETGLGRCPLPDSDFESIYSANWKLPLELTKRIIEQQV